jgi:hypothetical protein
VGPSTKQFIWCIWSLRAAPKVFSLWPSNLKLDDEEYVVEQNSFGPTFSNIMLNLVKCTAKPDKCHVTAIFIALNKSDLTVDPYL